MYTITTVTVRPDTGVSFNDDSAEADTIYDAMSVARKAHAGYVSSTHTTSPDGLTKTSVLTWADKASADEFRTDFKHLFDALNAVKEAHKDAVGLVITQTTSGS